MTRHNSAPVQAVLFDWDGTLLNSYRADSRAFLETFHAMGVKWDIEDLARHYSPDWYHMFQAAGIPQSRWAEADQIWRRAYRRQKPELLPGARRVLRALERRYTLALVSSGSRSRILEQLRRFRLSRLFTACVCGDDAARRKPDPEPLLLALRRLRVPPDVSLYVGDAPEDIEMAHRAGVRAIGVLSPFPTERRLRAARPEALLSSIEDLPRLLRTQPEAS